MAVHGFCISILGLGCAPWNALEISWVVPDVLDLICVITSRSYQNNFFKLDLMSIKCIFKKRKKCHENSVLIFQLEGDD